MLSGSSLTHPESERAVLGALLLDGRLFRSSDLGDLVPDDFGDQRHQRIYRAMSTMAGEEVPIDLRTVQAALQVTGELEAAGGLSYLAGLDADLPDLSRVGSYVQIVRRAAIRRRLVDALRKSVQRLSDGDAPFGEVVSEANAALRRADERIAGDRLAPLGECFDLVREALEHPAASGIVGISTGFGELDRMTLGLQAGQLVVVAGRPGQGKTALACGMARAACEDDAPGVYFSLEMGRDELATRLVCSETGLPFNLVRSGHLSTGRREMVERAIATLSKLPLILNDSPYLTPSRLAALIRRAKRQIGAQFAVVDYLGLLAADDHFETRNLELGAISRALKVLAKELEIPIIALHQLSRAPEKRADPRPVLSDLRDSGAIEQDADAVIFVYRSPDPEVQEAELIVAKQRNGMTGAVRVKSVLSAFRFDSLDPTPTQSQLALGGA